MILRPYQDEAVAAVLREWKDHPATLVVQPTGTGKTVQFVEVIRQGPPGNALILAHREELIHQAAEKVEQILGVPAEVEMADQHSEGVRWGERHVIVSSIQTQIARTGEGKLRMERFDPAAFSMVIVDEAHHAVAKSYRKVLEHYQQNKDVRILGVTATPDRKDEEALGQVFTSVAYVYEIRDAINDGWLVPIAQRAVMVESLDFSHMRTTAGDLNGADLEQAMLYERTLHEIATPTLELCQDKQALVFAASVAHAERLCEIFNRHEPDCARWVCGKTPKDERARTVAGFRAGRFQYLVNVGVYTEGFDVPSIDCVVMARPTKSRALYTQMVGRGMRPLPGIVDEVGYSDSLFESSTSTRRERIADSGKDHLLVIDFVGNAGRHHLQTAVDILGGKESDEVLTCARKIIEQAGRAIDTEEAIEMAEDELRLKAEAERKAELARRAQLRASGVEFRSEWVDPFDLFAVRPPQERGWNKGRLPTEKQVGMLQRCGIETDGLSFTDASALIGEVIERNKQGLCSFKQARLISQHGYHPDATRAQANQIIMLLKQNGWQRPEPSEIGAY